jgi:cell division transport system ATP-binding protein
MILLKRGFDGGEVLPSPSSSKGKFGARRRLLLSGPRRVSWKTRPQPSISPNIPLSTHWHALARTTFDHFPRSLRRARYLSISPVAKWSPYFLLNLSKIEAKNEAFTTNGAGPLPKLRGLIDIELFGVSVIRFENVSKLYPGQEKAALESVNLEVVKGEFVFLVGLSGSGKSTFLRLVLREDRPSAGTIHVAGKNLNTLATHKVPELRRQVGTVFQDFRLLPNKTIFENVAFTLHVLGYSKKEIAREVPEVLELVGLEDKGERRPSEISGGEQQRVAIARAYVSRPAILIADEPTGNLDPATSVGIMKLLDRINREGTTVVMATHDSGIVDQMRKRVIELDAGHVIRDQVRGVYGYTG